jgi:hypothetical protein
MLNLKDKAEAMALLWRRRSVRIVLCMYSCLLSALFFIGECCGESMGQKVIGLMVLVVQILIGIN